MARFAASPAGRICACGVVGMQTSANTASFVRVMMVSLVSRSDGIERQAAERGFVGSVHVRSLAKSSWQRATIMPAMARLISQSTRPRCSLPQRHESAADGSIICETRRQFCRRMRFKHDESGTRVQAGCGKLQRGLHDRIFPDVTHLSRTFGAARGLLSRVVRCLRAWILRFGPESCV